MTDVDGATFSGLPPGRYSVSVAGAPAIRVMLNANDVVSLELMPPVAGAAAVLRVMARHRDSAGTHFDESDLRRLPTGAGLWGLLDTAAPFVIVDRMDGGGIGLGWAGRVGSRGAPWRDTELRVDGLPVARGPVSADQVGFLPDLDSLESVGVVSGLARADIASPGATIALMPRRPPAARGGALNASFTAPGFVSTNSSIVEPSIARLTRWTSAGAQFGGPVATRTGVFGSVSTARARHVDRRHTEPTSSSLHSALVHLVSNRGERSQLRWMASVQRATQPYRPLRRFAPRAAERDTLFLTQGVWEHQLANGGRWQAAVGFQRDYFTPTGASTQSISMERLDGLVPAPVSGARVGRLDGRVVFAPPEARGHALEFGVSIARAAGSSEIVAAPRVEETVAGLPARVWITGPPAEDSQRRATYVAAYIADRIRLGANATADVGLRFSESTGSAVGAAAGLSWSGLQPRAHLRWSPRIMSLFVGYGRYQPELPLHLLAFGDPGEPLRSVHRWNDANGDGAFQVGETGQLVALAGRAPAIASIDPSVASPFTHEFTFGGERRFGTSVGTAITLGATGTIRRERNIPRSVNTGAPLSAYRQLLVPDRGVFYDTPDDDEPLPVYDRLPSSFGLDRYVLTNVDDDVASYDGIEISVDVRRARWWSFAGASAYRSEAAGANRGFDADQNDHGVIGEIFENPNANSYAFGRSFFDRAYVLKWATGFEAPKDFSAAVVARYQDGQAFSRLVLAPDLAQGPELVAAYRAGRTRFTFTATIDARVEKRFALARGHAAVRLEIYNLPNLGLEVEEAALTGAVFRRTTAVQPPRAVRLGFHLSF